MKAALVVFPGSNCDRDMARALEAAYGRPPLRLWHEERHAPAADLYVLPGGFSWGDYLRCGAIAARAPVMTPLMQRAAEGALVLGVCNGFQILTEAGLLPGALVANREGAFVCRRQHVRVENEASPFLGAFRRGQALSMPIAHQCGRYVASRDTLKRLNGEGQVLLRYCAANGALADDADPNGSEEHIAGVCNAEGNVFGLMPHPERAFDPVLEGSDALDGLRFFTSLARAS